MQKTNKKEWRVCHMIRLTGNSAHVSNMVASKKGIPQRLSLPVVKI